MATSKKLWNRFKGLFQKHSNTQQKPTAPQKASQQPKTQKAAGSANTSTMPTLQVALQNQTSSSNVWAYISKSSHLALQDPRIPLIRLQLGRPWTITTRSS